MAKHTTAKKTDKDYSTKTRSIGEMFSRRNRRRLAADMVRKPGRAVKGFLSSGFLGNVGLGKLNE